MNAAPPSAAGRGARRRARPALHVLAALALGVCCVAAGGVWAFAQPGPAPLPPLAGAADEAPVAFRHLTADQGLPSPSVYAVTQDALGFVWVGTADGLARYDGVELQSYRHRASDSSSVAGNEIQALAAGPGGSLWVGTSAGLSRYDPARDAFETVTGLPSANVLALAADTLGGVWAGTARGVARVEPGTLEATAVRADGDAMVNALLLDGATLWLGTDDGLTRFDTATRRARTFRPDSAGTAVAALARSERGQILVGTAGSGLFAFAPQTGRFASVDIGDGLLAAGVSAVFEDTGGTVWVGTVGAGLRRLTPGAGVTVFRADPSVPASLADDRVSAVFEDRQGILWAATYGGLDRFDRAAATAVRLRHSDDDAASIASNDVRSALVTRDGTLYVGTDRSLDRSVDGRTFAHTDVSAVGGLGQHAVSALYQDRAGTVWAGTEGAGFFRLTAPDALEKAPVQGEGVNLSVQTFFEERSGHFWIGTVAHGLILYDRAARTAQFIRARIGQKGALASDNVRALAQTADGALWVGTNAGLCRMDGPGGPFTCADEAEGGAAPVVRDDVLALHATRDGSLWIGTRSGFVHLGADGKTTRFTMADSDLPGDAVSAITEDESGTLWLSTSGGLSQFDPPTGVFADRLGTGGVDRTLGTAAARAPDGRIFAGGAGGLLAFYPRKLDARNANPPQVVITGVDVLGKPVTPGPESALDAAAPVATALRLRYDEQQVITLHYTGLHFSDPERIRYRVRLEGLNEEWLDAGRARDRQYTNLSPGDYTFHVQAATADGGVWSDPGAMLKITVTPPWWRTTWAMLAFAALAVVALVRGERWQKVRLLKQERERAERREAELRAETAEAELAGARSVREANAKLEAANERLEASLQDLQATQAQLVQSEKLASLGQLTAGIAHEIKNPLNFVNNFAELSVDLAADLRTDLEAAAERPVSDVLPDIEPLLDDLRDNARRIHEHGQRADRIVRAMLLHSRGGAVERARVDVNRFADEYANLAYHGARANDSDLAVNLVRDLAPDAGEAEVVPQELGRVLINLLSNAFHAVGLRRQAGEPGYDATVTLHTRRLPEADGDLVEIALEDNGPGIPTEALEKIFEPFFTTKASGEGTGLGLSLAHDIVTQVHGGTLTVESAVGVGTTFTVRIPAGVPAPVPV